MTLTRKMLKDLGIEEDAVDAIIKGHAETVDALKDEKAKLQDRVDELESQKDGTDWQERYNQEHEAFESFKADAEKSAAEAEKAALYRKLLEGAGVDPKRIDSIMRVTDLSEVAVKDGRLEKEKELSESIKEEWSAFIAEPVTRGVNVPTPPSGGGKTMTRDEIMAIKDTQERQRTISDNIELFTGGK